MQLVDPAEITEKQLLQVNNGFRLFACFAAVQDQVDVISASGLLAVLTRTRHALAMSHKVL